MSELEAIRQWLIAPVYGRHVRCLELTCDSVGDVWVEANIIPAAGKVHSCSIRLPTSSDELRTELYLLDSAAWGPTPPPTPEQETTNEN